MGSQVMPSSTSVVMPANKDERGARRQSASISMVRRGFVALCLVAGSQLAQSQQAQPSITSIQTLIRSRQLDPAIQQIKTLLKKTPGDVRLWTLDGLVLSLQGKIQEAIVAFDKALQISPNFSAALKGEVQLFYQTQDKRAIPLLEELVKQNPEDETAQEMLASLEAKEGNCDAANSHFLLSAEAIDKHPGSLEAYGSCLMQTRQYEQAINVFKQLSALLPEQTYPKYDLAVALVEAKQNAEAVQVLAPLAVNEQTDPDVLSLASDAYEATGDTPKAVALLRQAIVLEPTNAAYYNAFAALSLDHESFRAGIDMINAGLERIPKDSSLYISRGMLYAQLAQYDQAEADFKTAELLDSGQSLSSYAIDLAELQRNDPASALAKVRAQLKAHPDSALLQYLLAKLLSTQGADTDPKVFDEATQSALLALKLKPDMTEARDLLATMYSHNGQYSLAVEQCRLALKTNPNDQTAMYHLLIALRHTGQGEQRAEIQDLVKRLAELQKTARQDESNRKKFKLETQQTPPQ
jgi:tetratricopeptide (TPR) repeat protein